MFDQVFEIVIYYFSSLQSIRYACIGFALLFLILTVISYQLFARVFFGLLAASTMGMTAFLFETLGMAWSEQNAQTEHVDSHIRKQQRLIGELGRDLAEQHQYLGVLVNAAKQYDKDAYDLFSSMIIVEHREGTHPFFAVKEAAEQIVYKWRKEMPSAADGSFLTLSVHYKSLFQELKKEDPAACSRFMTGREMFRDAGYSHYRLAVRDGLMMKDMAKGKNFKKSTVSKEEALNFAERVIGAEKLDGLMAQSLPFDDLCDALLDIYSDIADVKANSSEWPKHAAVMRHWAFPENFYREEKTVTPQRVN